MKLNNLIDNINKKGKTQREWMTVSGEGHYIIRICPEIENPEEAPFEEFYLHSGFVHPVYKTKSAIKCFGKGCPMCQYAKDFAMKDRERAWQFKSKQYYVYNVIDRSNGQLKLLKVTWAAHNAIIAKIIEAAKQEINIMSLTEGRDLEIVARKVSNKLVYKCHILSERETKPVAGRLQEELKLVRPLRDAYRSYTEDELASIIKGEVPVKTAMTKNKAMSKSSLIENLQKKVRQSQSNAQINKEEVVVKKPVERSKKSSQPEQSASDFNDNIFEDENE